MNAKRYIIPALLAAAMTVVSIAATAQEPLVVEGASTEPIYQERVSFSDLDLRHASDQRKLFKRVRAAAGRVCYQAEGPFPRVGVPGYGNQDPSLTCADLTYLDARQQSIAAIDRVEAGQQMAVNNIVIRSEFAR